MIGVPSIYSNLAFSAMTVTNRVITDDFEVGFIVLSSVNVSEIKNGLMTITDGNIYNSISFNGVVIDKHGSRHNFNGDDPLSPALDGDIQELTDFVGSSGTSNRIPRADHVHYHGQRSGGNLHSAVTTTSNGFMLGNDKNKLDFFINPSNNIPLSIGITSPGTQNNFSRSDHVHYHGIQTGGSLHETATVNTNGFMSSSDKVMLNRLSLNSNVMTLNGIFSTSNPVYCFVYGNENVNIPVSTNFALNGTYFTNPQLNGIEYINGAYSLLYSGYYRIQLNPSIYFPISNTSYIISVMINNVTTNGIVITNNSGFDIMTENICFENTFNASDIITITILHTDGGPDVFSSNQTNSKLSIIKLS